jgi:hypothetical protein
MATIVKPKPIISATSVFNVKDFGVKADGITDDSPAIQKILDAVGTPGYPGVRGGIVYLPKGVYRLGSPLIIRRGISLQGAGSSMWTAATELLADPGVTAIKTAYGYGPTAIEDGADKEGATGSGCIISNLMISQSSKSDKISHGIEIKVKTHIEFVLIQNFSGCGIHLEAYVPNSNANSCSFTNVFSCGNDQHGFYVNSSDSNGCLFSNCCSYSNKLNGFHETSFLGNTYIGCTTESNGERGFYHEGGVNTSTFIGCYTESNQKPSYFEPAATVIGGMHAAGLDNKSTGMYLNGMGASKPFAIHNYNAGYGWGNPWDKNKEYKKRDVIISFDDVMMLECAEEGTSGEVQPDFASFKDYEKRSEVIVDGTCKWKFRCFTATTMSMGAAGETNPGVRKYLNMNADDDNGSFTLELTSNSSSNPRRWAMHWGDHATYRGLEFASASSGPRPGAVIVSKGIHLGDSENRITYSYEKPSYGFYKKGDIIFNNQPEIGKPTGWICLTTGGNDDIVWSFKSSPLVGHVYIPTVKNGYSYQCIYSGPQKYTGDVEPLWNTDIGQTIEDGDIIWECIGKENAEFGTMGFIMP